MHDPCVKCRKREQKVFSGERTIDDFGSGLFNGENAGAMCLAHDTQACDLCLLMEHMHSISIKCLIIQNGKKFFPWRLVA